MQRWHYVACVVLLTFTVNGRQVAAVDLLAPGDTVLAIDLDPDIVNSSYPDAEPPWLSLDNDVETKYLNFGKEGSGLIFTPFSGAATIQSMMMRTANDSPERDPASWTLYGTNGPIVSPDNGDGNGETWELISSGAADLPVMREMDGPVYSFPANTSSYSSFKIEFPTLRDAAAANSMQVADVNLYASSDGSGTPIGDFFDFAIAFGPVSPDSRYPLNGPNGPESPVLAVDGDPMTKYLNFGKTNSGFIVTPSIGSSIVEGFEITTANDFSGRDPASFELYGTNDAVLSTDNSRADGGEAWTLISAGDLTLPEARFTAGGVVSVTNTVEYASYLMVFPTVKDEFGDMVDSMQIADIQFFGQATAAVTGDFNNDGSWDCADIDALVAEVVSGNNTASFDMNGDGVVNVADVTDPTLGWLTVGGANNVADTDGNPFRIGDANLDGSVDVSDFNIWNGQKFTATAAWCAGDFTIDGSVDVSDFNAWNGNKFTMSGSGTAVVPEPGAYPLAALCLLGLAVRRQSAGQR